jgi:hypothetical protein
MLVSDHPHLFETGGENYHSDFNAWLYERGHESDPCPTTPDPSWMGTPTLAAERAQIPHAYDISRSPLRVLGSPCGITDGRLRYLRGCGESNFPLAMWSNRWSTMPTPAFPQIRLPRPDARATLHRMPGTDVPVIRQPFEAGDRLPFWAGHLAPSDSYLPTPLSWKTASGHRTRSKCKTRWP